MDLTDFISQGDFKMSVQSQLMERGDTYYAAQTAQADVTANADNPALEGAIRYFSDRDPDDKVKCRSGGLVKCILVRNVSGISLLPKRLVRWQVGDEGKQVDGYANTEWMQVAGVVDEHLGSAGVRDDDLFWIAVEGRSLVQTEHVNNATAAADIGVGNWLVALSSANSTNDTLGGHPNPLLLNSAATTQCNQITNRIGRALTARTTSETATDMLVDLKIA